MQYPPHQALNMMNAKRRIKKIGRLASILFYAGYNSPHLRVLSDFRRYQIIE